MKKLFLLFCLIIVSGYAKSQNEEQFNLPNYEIKPYHLGFTLGINRTGLDINTNPDLADSILAIPDAHGVGFNFGIVANMRINSFIDLRFIPEISFGNNESLIFFSLNNNNFVKETYSFETTKLNLPLLLKFRYKRIRNICPYMTVGGSFQYGLNRNTHSGTNLSLNLNRLNLKDSDYCFEVGVGIDNYLKYFKFSPEIKFSLGLQNLNLKNSSLYSRAFDKITSRIIVLNLHFE